MGYRKWTSMPFLTARCDGFRPPAHNPRLDCRTWKIGDDGLARDCHILVPARDEELGFEEGYFLCGYCKDRRDGLPFRSFFPPNEPKEDWP